MQPSNAASLVFPRSKPLPEILGEPRLRHEVLKQIYSDSETLFHFNQLTQPDQEVHIPPELHADSDSICMKVSGGTAYLSV